IPNDPCNEQLLINLFEQAYGNPVEFTPSLFALIRKSSLNEYVFSIAKDRTQAGKEVVQSVDSHFPNSQHKKKNKKKNEVDAVDSL
ncbi:hypothetical protein PMAYCL1PPCAC_19554, partial [Pristionchus mayeri]